ncbi:MAG: hypothetical protein DA408_19025 [Bacteroidetes bacterium]|nr:MAG: hypothetical protein C7N36_04300 [Bacteroidota bacterium]PTM09156.1 MAG: hypothetical protein DA408_19025 [Bacteroidota bacterium]
MESNNQLVARNKSRIVFIDVLRAYAILMMLQGHFVDTFLATAFRSPDSPLYVLWAFMRGMTAPIFFTVTGLVFTYLLLRDGRPLKENKRVKKGLRRGVQLVGIGYLLKLNFFGLLIGQIYPWVWTIDVLHIIGIALLSLIGVVALREKIGASLPLLMLAFGVGTFFMDPFFTENSWAHLPRVFANYLTRDFGSSFTIVPWIGFAFFGGALGAVLSHRPNLAFTNWFPALLLAFGITLTVGSYQLLVNLYELTGWSYLAVLFKNHYLFWRLGHVFIVIPLFMWVVPRLPVIPALVTKIGSETLTIYGAHYVVLYGTWLGLGLSQIIGPRSLDPLTVAVGALTFVLSAVFMIVHIEVIREWVYVTVPAWFRTQYRRLNVWYYRELPKQLAFLQERWETLADLLSSWLLPLAQVFSSRNKD